MYITRINIIARRPGGVDQVQLRVLPLDAAWRRSQPSDLSSQELGTGISRELWGMTGLGGVVRDGRGSRQQ